MRYVLCSLARQPDGCSQGVHLTGQMNGWTTPKDLILHVAGKLTVRVSTTFVLIVPSVLWCITDRIATR